MARKKVAAAKPTEAMAAVVKEKPGMTGVEFFQQSFQNTKTPNGFIGYKIDNKGALQSCNCCYEEDLGALYRLLESLMPKDREILNWRLDPKECEVDLLININFVDSNKEEQWVWRKFHLGLLEEEKEDITSLDDLLSKTQPIQMVYADEAAKQYYLG